jgi:hypothetical protein
MGQMALEKQLLDIPQMPVLDLMQLPAKKQLSNIYQKPIISGDMISLCGNYEKIAPRKQGKNFKKNFNFFFFKMT